MAISKNRYAYLDALRGIAVLSVFIFHTSGYLNSSNGILSSFLSFLVFNIADWGRFGVVLFFLISGFIIPQSLNSSSSLRSFIVNRFFRLYPAFWFSLFVVFFITPLLSSKIHFSTQELLANATMIPKLWGVPEMSGIFWTLFVEIVFYLLCVILFKLKKIDHPLMIGFIVFAFNFITPTSILLNKFLNLNVPVQFLLFHLSFLFLGNLFRMVLLGKNKAASLIAKTLTPIIIFNCALVSGCFFYVDSAIKAGFVVTSSFCTLMSYTLAICLFFYTVRTALLSDKFLLIQLGKVSYSVYLLHMTCIVFCVKLIGQPSSGTQYIMFLLFAGSVTFIVANLSFVYIESIGINIGKKVTKRYVTLEQYSSTSK